MGAVSSHRTIAFLAWDSPSRSKQLRISGCRTAACSLKSIAEVTQALTRGEKPCLAAHLARVDNAHGILRLQLVERAVGERDSTVRA